MATLGGTLGTEKETDNTVMLREGRGVAKQGPRQPP
jgi:hypothetical protein